MPDTEDSSVQEESKSEESSEQPPPDPNAQVPSGEWDDSYDQHGKGGWAWTDQ